MATIVTRAGKGSPLTSSEVDSNFTNLNTDKAELSGATFTGDVTSTGFAGDITGAVLFQAKAGEGLTKGDPVYISGISGNQTVVSKADANDANKMPCFGIVDATVSINANCSVVTFGTLSSLNTSAFSEGDELYISDTGTLSATAPTGEASQLQKIAKVTRSHASAGSIKVMGAGRTNATPNLDDGKFFLGNSSNQSASATFSTSVTGIALPLSGGAMTGAITTNSTFDGRDVATDGTKLDTVETNADVTDATNVTAAGALMDSELTSIASVKALDQGVATTDSPTFAAATVTGEITANGGIALGDSDKATFGAGDDLQIYHNSSNNSSYIDEGGAGDLYVRATNIWFQNTGPTATLAKFTSGGAIELRHNDGIKFATTSTGIDVTGTATMDAVALNTTLKTWDASTDAIQLQSGSLWNYSTSQLNLGQNEYYNGGYKYLTTGAASTYNQASGGHFFKTAVSGSADGAITWVDVLGIDAAGRVGIGTSSFVNANAKFVVSNGTVDIEHYTDSAIGYIGTRSNHPFGLLTNGTPKLYITTAGNVGIGTSSPSKGLHLNFSNDSAAIRFQNTANAKVWDLTPSIPDVANSGFSLHNVTDNTVPLHVDNSGNVGIGTSSPSYEFVVSKDGSSGIEFGPEGINSTTSFIQFYNRSTAAYDTARFYGSNYEWYLNAAQTGMTLSTTSLVVNEGGVDADFRVESDNDANAFFVQGSNGFVGMGTGSPVSITGAAGPVLDMQGPNPEIVFHDNSGTANSMSMYYLNDTLTFWGAGAANLTLTNAGNLTVAGALSKGSGSFKIDHPLPAKTETHNLVHSFIEGPQADNIYRGKVTLVDGSATVNIDTVSGMSEGTYVLLNTNTQCFTSNESGWNAVKGSVSGNILTITAQESCSDTISWMVVGERHDQHMLDTEWTDENGKVIVEPLKKLES